MGKKLLLIAFCCAFVNVLYGDVTLPDQSWEVLRNLHIYVDKDNSVSQKPWTPTFEFIETRLPQYVYDRDRIITGLEKQLAKKDEQLAKKDAELAEIGKEREKERVKENIIVAVLGIICVFLLFALIWVLKCKKPFSAPEAECSLIEVELPEKRSEY